MTSPGVDPSQLPLWSVTTMRPRGVTAELLGVRSHIRQCTLYGRAKSRVAFARMLIQSGIERRSEAAVSAWLRDWGNPSTGYKPALAAVTDQSVWVSALHHREGMPFLRYPDDVIRP